MSHSNFCFVFFSFVDEYLKQAPHEHNALVNAISTNPNLSTTDINLLMLEIFFGGIDAVSAKMDFVRVNTMSKLNNFCVDRNHIGNDFVLHFSKSNGAESL